MPGKARGGETKDPGQFSSGVAPHLEGTTLPGQERGSTSIGTVCWRVQTRKSGDCEKTLDRRHELIETPSHGVKRGEARKEPGVAGRRIDWISEAARYGSAASRKNTRTMRLSPGPGTLASDSQWRMFPLSVRVSLPGSAGVFGRCSTSLYSLGALLLSLAMPRVEPQAQLAIG